METRKASEVSFGSKSLMAGIGLFLAATLMVGVPTMAIIYSDTLSAAATVLISIAAILCGVLLACVSVIFGIVIPSRVTGSKGSRMTAESRSPSETEQGDSDA